MRGVRLPGAGGASPRPTFVLGWFSALRRPLGSLIMGFRWELNVDLAKIRKKARGGAPGGTRAAGPPPEAEPSAPAAQAADPDVLPEPAADSESPAIALPTAQPAKEDTAAPAEPAAAGERLLIFDLDGEKYAIPIHDIAQIIDMPPATFVPNAPPFLSGILSLRGRIVSIINVASRLGLISSKPEAPKVIVLDLGADHIGLLVDQIDQVVEVNVAALEPVPEGFKPVVQDFVEGVFHHKGRAVGFLNLPMFLAFDV